MPLAVANTERRLPPPEPQYRYPGHSSPDEDPPPPGPRRRQHPPPPGAGSSVLAGDVALRRGGCGGATPDGRGNASGRCADDADLLEGRFCADKVRPERC